MSYLSLYNYDHYSPQAHAKAAKSTQEFMSKSANVGPPDFSSSSTAPKGLGDMMNYWVKNAMRATSDSIMSLETITITMERNDFFSEYPQLFRIYFHHLKSPPPAQCITEADRVKALIGAACFHGVSTLYELLQRRLMLDPDRHTSNSLLIRLLTDSWPDIWKWIKYLYWVNPKIFTLLIYPITPARFKAMTVRILSCGVCGAKTAFGDAVAATPEVFTMLVDLWVKLSEVKVVDVERQFDSSCAAFAILRTMENDPPKIRKFLDLLGGDNDRIATLMLKNWRQALNINEKEARASQFQLILMFSAIIANSVPGLHHALLSQNSMVLVTRTFGRISSIHAESFDGTSFMQLGPYTLPDTSLFDPYTATATCVLYIQEASSTSGGFTWIIQAIRSGMIPAILRSACRGMEEIDHQLLIDRTIKAIEPYLVYRSVLRAVSKAFQDPIIRILESKLPRDRVFYSVWVKFRELVNLRLALKEQFDADGAYAQGCSSANCNNIEGNEHFRLCSNCLDACYCSEACQKRDWKNGGHRAACASLRKARADGVSPPISVRDTFFIFFLATNDVSMNRDEILRIRDEFFASDPTSRDSFIINVDPSSHPSRFSISAPNDQPKYRMYAQIRHYAHQPPAVVVRRDLPPSLFEAMVDIYMVVPYGAEKVILPSRTWQFLCLYGNSSYNWKDLVEGHLKSPHMQRPLPHTPA